jgi:hypothetical protein
VPLVPGVPAGPTALLQLRAGQGVALGVALTVPPRATTFVVGVGVGFGVGSGGFVGHGVGGVGCGVGSGALVGHGVGGVGEFVFCSTGDLVGERVSGNTCGVGEAVGFGDF